MKKYTRLQDPKTINSKEILDQIESGNEVVVQFSEIVYDSKNLHEIDKLCKVCNDDLCVRFYGHYQTGFDCGVLKYLPNVKNLYLDCLHTVSNFPELKNLHHLKRLNIGIFELDERDFLSWDNLKNVSFLCLVETRKNNFDLKHLTEYSNIETLFLNGHTKNIDSVERLSKLSKLSLCVPSSASIEFINQLPNLSKLTFILGGRSNLDEVHNSSIEELEIIRVRGFSSFDNIGEFSKLRRLLIEDQIQVSEINIRKTLPNLTDLKILNCKSLSRLEGVHNLPGLNHLRISKTAIDFSEFIKQTFPTSLRTFAFYTTKAKVDKVIHAELQRLGYSDGLSH